MDRRRGSIVSTKIRLFVLATLASYPKIKNKKICNRFPFLWFFEKKKFGRKREKLVVPWHHNEKSQAYRNHRDFHLPCNHLEAFGHPFRGLTIVACAFLVPSKSESVRQCAAPPESTCDALLASAFEIAIPILSVV